MLFDLIISAAAIVLFGSLATATTPGGKKAAKLLGKAKWDALLNGSVVAPKSNFFNEDLSWQEYRILMTEPLFCGPTNSHLDVFKELCKGKDTETSKVLVMVHRAAVKIVEKSPIPQLDSFVVKRGEVWKHALVAYKSLKLGPVEELATELTGHLFNVDLAGVTSRYLNKEKQEELKKNSSNLKVKNILTEQLTAIRKVLTSPFQLVPQDFLPVFTSMQEECKKGMSTSSIFNIKQPQWQSFCQKVSSNQCGDVVGPFNEKLTAFQLTWDKDGDFAKNDLRLCEIEKEAVKAVKDCLKLGAKDAEDEEEEPVGDAPVHVGTSVIHEDIASSATVTTAAATNVVTTRGPSRKTTLISVALLVLGIVVMAMAVAHYFIVDMQSSADLLKYN